MCTNSVVIIFTGSSITIAVLTHSHRQNEIHTLLYNTYTAQHILE